MGKHYAELERRYEEAERAENWKRAERIGDALAEMEQNSGFKKCFACGRKGCPPMPTVSLHESFSHTESNSEQHYFSTIHIQSFVETINSNLS